MSINIKSILAGAVLGAVVYHIAAFFVLGHTAAIALPESIATWATENSARFPVIFMWDFLVVQLLGVGILSAISTYVILRAASFDWLCLAIGFLTADIILSLASILTLPKLEYVSVDNFIGWLPHFIVVFLCVFIAARLGRKKRIIACQS
jgi:hypothetical protein